LAAGSWLARGRLGLPRPWGGPTGQRSSACSARRRRGRRSPRRAQRALGADLGIL